MGFLDLLAFAGMWYAAIFGFALLVIGLITLFERIK
jgi:hypothetical protein